MLARSRRNLLLTAVLCAASATSWPNPKGLLIGADDRKQALARFIAKKKFVKKPLYAGVTDEKDRLRYEALVNKLARSLGRLRPADQTKAVFLQMFGRTMDQFEDADREEQDRFLRYLEELLDIFGIDRSDDLIGQWRYGSNTRLRASIEASNANALAVMTPTERELLERLQGMTTANAEETLRALFGPPVAEYPEIKIWSLTSDPSSLIGLSMRAGALVFIWIEAGRFTYSRRL